MHLRSLRHSLGCNDSSALLDENKSNTDLGQSSSIFMIRSASTGDFCFFQEKESFILLVLTREVKIFLFLLLKMFPYDVSGYEKNRKCAAELLQRFYNGSGRLSWVRLYRG